MPDAAYFRAKAEQCRGLLKLTANGQVIEQLRLWISDFEATAARAGRRVSSDRLSGRVVVRRAGRPLSRFRGSPSF